MTEIKTRTRTTIRCNDRTARHRTTCRQFHLGLTLLEVILALALTAVILAMIGGIIGMHTRITDSAKRTVETTELATAIMSLIIEDIRGTQVDNALITMHDAALEIPVEEGEEVEVAAAADGEANTEEVPPEEELLSQVLPVGLYGTESFLRLDTAKVRRTGRRWPSSGSSTTRNTGSATVAPTNELSELRTISYGMDVSDSAEEVFGLMPPGAQPVSNQPVLMRSSRDRSVSAFFTANLGGDDEQLFAQPMATEVASIQFRYFDGVTWMTEWDTFELGGLPLAVEVTLLMNPPPGEDTNLADLALLESDLTFRRTVQIPTSRPLLQEEAL